MISSSAKTQDISKSISQTPDGAGLGGELVTGLGLALGAGLGGELGPGLDGELGSGLGGEPLAN